ncbi:hypothetical protein AMTRI_Chr04g253080 [Amborella trichopoda]
MSQSSMNSMFRDCKTLKDLKRIHAHTIKTGFMYDPLILGKLLLFAATSIPDAIDYAQLLFAQIPSPDPFMWNTLIRGQADNNPHDSIKTYYSMIEDGIKPDNFTFAFIFKACAGLQPLRNPCTKLHPHEQSTRHPGAQLHTHAIKHGFDSHLYVQTTLVSMYASLGNATPARQVFNEMPWPNVVSWNAVLGACFKCRDVKGAKELFERMPWQNLTSWNTMIAGYMKLGDIIEAEKVFNEMNERDLVSWNTMIAGYSQNAWCHEALLLFSKLQASGLRANEVSLTGALSACAQLGAVEYGRVIHGFVNKAGFDHIVSVNNALLDMYAKCGSMDDARMVFNLMSEKSLVTWTAMMASLAMHGHGIDAISLFQDMEASGTSPDEVTFIVILYACSHAGMVQTGLEYFKMMDNYRLVPTMEHYGCIVDLYGRAGLLKQAYKFIVSMPIEPNAVVWRSLLGACSIHNDIEIAVRVREHLLEMEPQYPGDYVLLSNIYAMGGHWKDVASLRRSMNQQRIRKTPGWSAIEVDKVVYGFTVRDELSGVAKEAHLKLGEIMSRLRGKGYVAEIVNVLHDIDGEEKEEALSKHSEKLALAFGLSRMGERKGILRIVKNLRVCGDCHTVMKLVSSVYEREVLVRDRSRFHLFKDGSCNCHDYW